MFEQPSNVVPESNIEKKALVLILLVLACTHQIKQKTIQVRNTFNSQSDPSLSVHMLPGTGTQRVPPTCTTTTQFHVLLDAVLDKLHEIQTHRRHLQTAVHAVLVDAGIDKGHQRRVVGQPSPT